MTKKISLAAFGINEPGVIATLCGVLTGKNCNIVQSTQSGIDNTMTCLFVVEKPDELSNDELINDLKAAATRARLTLTLDARENVTRAWQPGTVEPFVVSVYGGDRNDIVGSFAKIFARYNVNIDDLRAIQYKESDFMIVYEVLVPTTTDIKAFHEELLACAKAMALTVTLQHRDIFEAVNRVQIF